MRRRPWRVVLPLGEALLGPAGGPARPAPARARDLHAVAVRRAPARAAPARPRPIGGLLAVGGAPARAAPARPGVVDLAGGGVDQVVRRQSLVGERDGARAGLLD